MKVAELLHFTQAAGALHVAQPTLSLQIRQLEDELGTRLFERADRTVRLTDSGELFLGYVKRALREIEAGQEGIQDLRGLLRGNLRIGVTYSFSADLLPRILAKFVQAHPNIYVHVNIGTNQQVQDSVAAGEVDLGLVCLSSKSTDFSSQRLFKEDIVVVVSRMHPLAASGSIRIRDLDDVRLALPTASFNTRRLIDAAFARVKAKQSVVLESDDVDVLLGLARLGVVAAMVTRQAAVHLHSGEIAIIPLKDRGLKLTAALIWRTANSNRPVAKRFLELATSHEIRAEEASVRISTR